MSDQNVVFYDGHPKAEAGIEEEDQHEDVVEDSVAIIVRTALQIGKSHFRRSALVHKSQTEAIASRYAKYHQGSYVLEAIQ